MPVPGKKLKEQVEGALDHYASQCWPDLEEVTITWRGSYGYLRAWTTMTEYIPLARIQYLGGDHYGFALYQASTETYADTRLPHRRLDRNPPRNPRLRPRPLPQQPHHLGSRPPAGLTRGATSRTSSRSTPRP